MIRAPARRPLARIGDEVLDGSVVDLVAARDGLDDATAREHVADTLRLVAAARDEASRRGTEATAELDEDRRAVLRRGALARLWLRETFEPSHRAEDIPDDDPMLVRGLADGRLVHPEVHRLCQLVAVPDGDLDPEPARARAADPKWRAQARARFDPAAERVRRYVRPDDPHACDEMARLLQFETVHADDVELRVESAAFVLDACGKQAPDGSCLERAWAPEWVEQVEAVRAPGFTTAFWTRFGRHLVFVLEVLPSHPADDPATATWVRSRIHDAWARAAFEQTMERLRGEHSVRIAADARPEGDAAQDPP